MLNRRLLRIKVMQALYGLKQSKIANYHNSLEYIHEKFAPDLLAAEKPDMNALEEKKTKALGSLEKYFSEKSDEWRYQDQEIKEAVAQAIAAYQNQVEKDKRHFGKMLTSEVEGIYENYLKSLAFLVELADYAITDNEDEKNKISRTTSGPIRELKLRDNTIIQLIRNNKEYISNTEKGKLVWDNDLVRRVFRQNLKADKEFREYLLKEEVSLEEQKNLALHIIKNIIFKDEAVQATFEERDIKWSENKPTIKSMVTRTIKGVEEGQAELKLLPISVNWEEDEVFFEDLYKRTVEREEEFENLVSAKVENWDIERLAALDRIILILAISEMINFPSIPVKVTINEYIELSKLYSTPKSKQFINGILDKLSEELISSGMIKKSGRGLIDNK